MSDRFTPHAATRAPAYCDDCQRSDTSTLRETGELMPLWLDNDTGELVCAVCKDKRTNEEG